MRSIYRFFIMLIAIFPQWLVYATDPDELHGGWYYWNPYQYSTVSENSDNLAGLDIQLSKKILKIIHKKIVLNAVSWKQQLIDIQTGVQDVVSGATYTAERAKGAYFSKPYRFEENSLFIKRSRFSEFSFSSVADMLKAIENKNYRIGIIDGYVYADPTINEWLSDQAHQPQIVRVINDSYNIENLLTDKIDCMLADRISGATLIYQQAQGHELTEAKLNIKTPIHFMFSRKTITPQFVAEFDKAIEQFTATTEYADLLSWYLHPVFLLQTIDTNWFRLIDYLGTIAFAISGLIIAHRDKSTLFGAFIFALAPSLGGGIIRDVIFNRKPVGALQSPTYLLIVIITVLVGYLFLHVARHYMKNHPTDQFISRENKTLQYLLVICDALGLAAFTVSGIIVSVLVQVSPLWLWGAFFSFLTGAAGGIIRDLLSKDKFIISISGTSPYAEISVVWGFFLAMFLQYQSQTIDSELIQFAVIFTVVGAFVTRMIVYTFNIPNIRFALPPDHNNQ